MLCIQNATQDGILTEWMESEGVFGVWLGLHDAESEGEFEWVDGCDSDYVGWGDGQVSEGSVAVA